MGSIMRDRGCFSTVVKRRGLHCEKDRYNTGPKPILTAQEKARNLEKGKKSGAELAGIRHKCRQ